MTEGSIWMWKQRKLIVRIMKASPDGKHICQGYIGEPVRIPEEDLRPLKASEFLAMTRSYQNVLENLVD